MEHASSVYRFENPKFSALSNLQEKDLPLFLDVESGGTEQETLDLIDQLPESGLSIVGSRYPQRRSVELMEREIKQLRGQNLIVISGFARGIDSRAHELALEVGLKTIAILGCGIKTAYPRENQRLKAKILDAGGLVISEFDRDCPAYAGNFLYRNRLIASFSKATWVVEAAAISGTLNTAKWAMQLDRDLYATSHFPGDLHYQGNEKLLSERNTHRHPLARSFFGVHSLAATWTGLDGIRNSQATLPLNPKTKLQRWVLEMAEENGSCHIQALMNFAYEQGKTPGSFYLEFEKEVREGYLAHHPDGRVTLCP